MSALIRSAFLLVMLSPICSRAKVYNQCEALKERVEYSLICKAIVQLVGRGVKTLTPDAVVALSDEEIMVPSQVFTNGYVTSKYLDRKKGQKINVYVDLGKLWDSKIQYHLVFVEEINGQIIINNIKTVTKDLCEDKNPFSIDDTDTLLVKNKDQAIWEAAIECTIEY